MKLRRFEKLSKEYNAMEQLNSKNFNDFVKKNEYAVIDFWAPWCGPCRALAPIFEEVSTKKSDHAFAKVNVDECEELALTFGVNTIPTILLFHKGTLVDRVTGYMSADDLMDFVGE